MTTDNFCFYLQNRLIQTSQTGGQLYSDTSPFSIPWLEIFLQYAPFIHHSLHPEPVKLPLVREEATVNLNQWTQL
jgi:hypothetical protein